MKIEDEIKQKKFSNEFHKALVNLMFTHSWFMDKHSKWLKPYGISVQQYNIMRILKGQYPKPAPLKLLTERMIDKMSNTSRLVEKLRAKGLVQREICPENRRKVDIIITDKGLELTEKMTIDLENELEKMSNLSSEEATNLSILLDKLRG